MPLSSHLVFSLFLLLTSCSTPSLLSPLTTDPLTKHTAAAFENLAPNAAVAQLGKALPGALQPVIDTVREGSKNLPALFARTPNADSAERVSDLQQVMSLVWKRERCTQMLQHAQLRPLS